VRSRDQLRDRTQRPCRANVARAPTAGRGKRLPNRPQRTLRTLRKTGAVGLSDDICPVRLGLLSGGSCRSWPGIDPRAPAAGQALGRPRNGPRLPQRLFRRPVTWHSPPGRIRSPKCSSRSCEPSHWKAGSGAPHLNAQCARDQRRDTDHQKPRRRIGQSYRCGFPVVASLDVDAVLKSTRQLSGPCRKPVRQPPATPRPHYTRAARHSDGTLKLATWPSRASPWGVPRLYEDYSSA
jgi:hypothetical protein